MKLSETLKPGDMVRLQTNIIPMSINAALIEIDDDGNAKDIVLGGHKKVHDLLINEATPCTCLGKPRELKTQFDLPGPAIPFLIGGRVIFVNAEEVDWWFVRYED